MIPLWSACQVLMASERPDHWKQGGECLRLTSGLHMNAHRCMHTCKHKHVHTTHKIEELLRMRKTVHLVAVLSVKQMLHSYLLELVCWMTVYIVIFFFLWWCLWFLGETVRRHIKVPLLGLGLCPCRPSLLGKQRGVRSIGLAWDSDPALPLFWIRGKFLTSLGLAAIVSILRPLSHCWSICQLCPAFYI